MSLTCTLSHRERGCKHIIIGLITQLKKGRGYLSRHRYDEKWNKLGKDTAGGWSRLYRWEEQGKKASKKLKTLPMNTSALYGWYDFVDQAKSFHSNEKDALFHRIG